MATLRFIFSMLLVAFTSSHVNASPAFLYEFSVKSFASCASPSSGTACTEDVEPFSFWKEELSKMRLTLDIDSIFNREAGLSIQSLEGGKIVNQGLMSLYLEKWGPISVWSPGNVPELEAGQGDVPLYESAYAFGANRFALDASFGVSQYLSGEFSVNNDFHDFSMRTSGSSLWSGLIRSDELFERSFEFTGEWNFVRVVPEPNTLLLLFGAAVAAGIALRRRPSQAQH
jgi:hypothetical protein